MAYTAITTSLIKSGRASLNSLFDLVRTNFVDHETRILALESPTTSAIPTGVVLEHGANLVPSGYLACDGSVLSRAAYSDLFAVIGTAFGDGSEGASNFRIPDLRGRVAIGSGTGGGLTARTLGASLGAETHVLSTAELAAHTHAKTDSGHTHVKANQQLGGPGGATANFYVNQNAINSSPTENLTTGSAVTGLSVDNTGSGGAHNNLQPSLVVGFIIKS